MDTSPVLQQAAKALFNSTYDLLHSSDDVWRDAQTMDTLLDYLALFPEDAQGRGKDFLAFLNPLHKGNWWDDFGWIGIAALRAAELNVFPEQRSAMLKIAINAWAYMHGPKWSASRSSVYPFVDSSLPGWQEFANGHAGNIGAPNSWTAFDAGSEREWITPRFTPGGIWNAPINAADFQTPGTHEQIGQNNSLSPIQNTVTNAVYTILSLRVWLAARNPAFAPVFSESGLNPDACRTAFLQQYEWLNNWMFNTTEPDAPLLFRTGDLVRERVSTFKPYGEWPSQYWDTSYSTTWVWTGDQGLIAGALREGAAAGVGASWPKLFKLYPALFDGTLTRLKAERNYGTVQGSFLLPWMQFGEPDYLNADAKGYDVKDYQTGPGVFLRYALQACRAQPALFGKFRQFIAGSAQSAAALGVAALEPNPPGQCDGFGSSGYMSNVLTNRLALILLALEMQKPA